MRFQSKKVFRVLLVLNLLTLILIGLIITLIRINYQNSLDLRQQSADENVKVSDLASLKQIIADTSSGRKYVENLFVDKEKVIDFLEFLESLGKFSGAEVKVISVDGGTADKPFNYTAIRFEAVGTWAQVFDVISLVDHIPFAFSVSNLQISKNSVDKDTKNPVFLWSAVINAKVLKLHK